jgi:hypothetical protein
MSYSNSNEFVDTLFVGMKGQTSQQIDDIGRILCWNGVAEEL